MELNSEKVNYGFEHDEKSAGQNGSTRDIELQDTSVVAANQKTRSFNRNRGLFARCFYSPITFLVILVIWSIIKASAGGNTSGTITSIEKRFQLKSTQIGLIAIVEDIVGLSTVMFIVHFGQSQHRPRVLGLLSLIVAFGVMLQGLPHFLYELPPALQTKVSSPSNSSNGTDTDDLVCLIGGTDDTQVCTAAEKAAAGSLIHEAFWIPLGSAVISLGGGIGPISITYLDDNVSRRAMPVYAAIVFSVFVFGSIFGFFLAGFTLSLPVTFPAYDTDYFNASPGDANWLGAWWLGYFICSFLLAVFGLLFCLFPRQLRDPEELAMENEEYLRNNPLPESAKAKNRKDFDSYGGIIEFLKDFLYSLKHVVNNVVVMSLIMAGCLTAFSSTVFLIFGPKFLMVVYELNPGFAAFVLGAFLIPGAFLGQIIGGVVIRALKLNRYGLAVVAVGTDSLLLLGIFFFYLIRCDKRGVAGLTAPYPGTTSLDNITSSCNVNCGCPIGVYEPVCGSDGITYVTPCHAGCDQRFNETFFENCACIVEDEVAFGEFTYGNATKGHCERPCSAWLFFILIMIPASFLGTFGGIAGFMLQLRSVDDAHRGLALSFGSVLVRLIGYIPGPVIIGFVIERSCVLYQSACGETGNCDLYDSDRFRIGFSTTLIVSSMMATFFIFIAYFYVRHTTPKGQRVCRIPDKADEEETKT